MSEGEQGEQTPDRRFLWVLLLYAGLVVGVFAFQIAGRGVISSPGMLLAELHADEHGPWQQGLDVPYRYRPLFRWVVLGTWKALRGAEDDYETFYGVFLTLSALSLLGAAAATDWYLRGLKLKPNQAVVGTVLFLVGFPVLFAYDIPVHTREDLLGYALIALTLGLVARGRWLGASIAACVGVWVRETCLLGILPLLFLQPRPRRAWSYYVAPALSFLCVRVLQHDPAHPFQLGELIRHSVQPALDCPGEAALYAFAAFGALWVAAGLRLATRDEPRHPLLSGRVVGVALAAVVLTGWVLGMVRENRITYILFPWVVPLATLFLTGPGMQRLRRAPAAWVAGGAVLLAGVALLLALTLQPDRITALRPWIGDQFNPGAGPTVLVPTARGEVSLDLAYPPPVSEGLVPLYSSRAEGPFVLWHLALSAFLLAGAAASRREPSCPPPSSPPCS